MVAPVVRGILFGAGVLGCAATGCTLVSGWGDIQGGAVDAGANDRDSASAGSDSAAVRCSAASCAPRVCCVHKDGTSGCVDTCTDPASAGMACASARDCGGGVCCLSTNFQKACAASCVTGLVACEPDDPGACPGNMRCNGGTVGAGGISVCQ